MSAFQFNPNDPLDYGVSLEAGIEVPGIQMFVGTESGSPVLPTIAGTPVHLPTTTAGNQGSAALVDMRGYKLDLGAMFDDVLFQDILLDMPDVQFKDRGHQIFGKDDTYVPVSIPITLYGEDNSANPGDAPTHSYNPVVNSVVPSHQGVSDPGQRFLFDTGAQLSVISTATALKLGLDLNNPEDTIDVQGASGTAEIPGFTIDSLLLPRDGGFLEFTKVPVFVLDIGEGIDGILGMNLFNGADEILYDPFRDGGPYLGVTFLHERTIEFEEGMLEEMESYQQEVAALQALLEELGGLELGDLTGEGLDLDLNMLTGAFGSRFSINGVVSIGAQVVPEPNSAILASVGLAMLANWRRRGLRRRVG